jgi:hypothetical protein
MFFPDIAVPKCHATPIHMAGLRPSDESTLQAFQDLRPLILRQGPPHLKEEPPLWSLFHRMRNDQQLHAGAFELLRQQELVTEVPRQAVRVIHDGGGNRVGVDEISELPQVRPVHGRTRETLVD